jgi:hypothetical protein
MPLAMAHWTIAYRFRIFFLEDLSMTKQEEAFTARQDTFSLTHEGDFGCEQEEPYYVRSGYKYDE